ncbi:DUF5908 family protein [Sphingomonas sp. CJ20]
MALFVSEIGVRIAVGDPQRMGPAEAEGCGSSGQASLSAQQVDAITRECTRRVLETLRLVEAR